jgi:hypothetical protein
MLPNRKVRWHGSDVRRTSQSVAATVGSPIGLNFGVTNPSSKSSRRTGTSVVHPEKCNFKTHVLWSWAFLDNVALGAGNPWRELARSMALAEPQSVGRKSCLVRLPEKVSNAFCAARLRRALEQNKIAVVLVVCRWWGD